MLSILKKMSKELYRGLSKYEKEKIMNFGDPSLNLVVAADRFKGAILPPLPHVNQS